MGLEIRCSLQLAGTTATGTAHLDSSTLTLRGGVKLVVPLLHVRSVHVAPGDSGDLRVVHTGGELTLRLGDRTTAEKWAQKIRSPKSLIDKLGLKPDSRVVTLGISDPEFRSQAAARLSAPPLEKLPAKPQSPGFDYIFFPADSSAELARLAALKPHLAPTGAIWVVSRKGPTAGVKDVDVMRAGHAAGLVDNKVCSFSATHTALKFVIPVAARG